MVFKETYAPTWGATRLMILLFPDFVIASRNIRRRKDTKYCLSNSCKIHVFQVTKSGKRSYRLIFM